MPIRHCVLVKIRDDIEPQIVDQVFADLKNLTKVIDGITDIHIGKNISPEGLNRNNTDGFTIDFPDMNALVTYLKHPAHQALANKLVSIVEGGVDGVTVVDFAMND